MIPLPPAPRPPPALTTRRTREHALPALTAVDSLVALSGGVRTRFDVKVPMRDGVDLSADLYLPPGDGPFPTVLMRTPYDNNGVPLIEKARRLAGRRLRRGGPGLPRAVRLRGHLLPVRRRGPGRVRHPGVDRAAGVVDRQDRHGRRLVPRPDPADQRPAAQPAPDLHGAAGHLRRLLQRAGLSRRRLPAQRADDLGHAHQRPHRPEHRLRQLDRGVPLAAAARGRPRGRAGTSPSGATGSTTPPTTTTGSTWTASAAGSEVAAPALNMGGWYDLYASQVFDTFTGLRRPAAARRRRARVS